MGVGTSERDVVAYYLGRALRVEAERCVWRRVSLDGDVLRVGLGEPANRARVQALVDAWFREQAAAYLPVCLREVCERSRTHLSNAGRPLSPQTAACPDGLRLTVRAMRTRWGSCSRDGHITLSTELIHAPRRLIDYVIVHELCHLVRLDHSRAFYFNLARCMPDWRERRLELQKRSWTQVKGGCA